MHAKSLRGASQQQTQQVPSFRVSAKGAPQVVIPVQSLFPSLFLPVIFGRFSALALIFLQILDRPPAPLYRDLQRDSIPTSAGRIKHGTLLEIAEGDHGTPGHDTPNCLTARIYNSFRGRCGHRLGFGGG
jgi:hypothetical protein